MIVVLEIAGLALVGLVVWVLYRAANARPEDSGLRWVARIGVSIWIGFIALWVVNLDLIGDDSQGALINALIASCVLVVVLGYRAVLGRLKDRAGR